jgi:RepB DNA-primase from phage plasmid
MFDRGFLLTMQAIRRQLAAMPHDLYLIRLVHSRTHRALTGKRLWTADQLLTPATIGFLRARNREGFDVYMHPDAWDQNAGFVLVDLDRADRSVLDRMRRNGHHPCLVLQTSPGHLQAWIQVAIAALQPCIATAVARQLARDYGGDPGSADWRHMGRLAGFTNQKPIRRNHRGDAPWVKIVHAQAGLAPNADALVKSAWHLGRPDGLSAATAQPSRWRRLPSLEARGAAALYHHCLKRWRITERFGPPDWSVVDLWVARHLLSQGVPASQVQLILQIGSPQFPRRHGNPDDYLRRTVARAAFPPTGGPV